MPFETARLKFQNIAQYCGTGRIDADIAYNFPVDGIPVFGHRAHPHRHGAHGLPAKGGSSVMFGDQGVGLVAGNESLMGCLRFQIERQGHSRVAITAYPNYLHMCFPHLDWDSNYLPKTFKAYRYII